MEFDDFAGYFTFLSPVILLVGVVFGIVYFNRNDKIHNILTWYIINMFFIDILSRYAGATLGNNLFLIPINGFVELLIFSIFFLESSNYLPFYKNKYWMILVAACLALTVYEVIDIFTSTFENFKSSSRIIMTLFIVLFSVYYFVYNILKQKKIIKTNFYLYSGILLYFSMILVIFLPIDFLIHDETGLKYYFWFANNIISCIFYTFLIVSICTNGKTQQTLHKA